MCVVALNSKSKSQKLVSWAQNPMCAFGHSALRPGIDSQQMVRRLQISLDLLVTIRNLLFSALLSQSARTSIRPGRICAECAFQEKYAGALHRSKSLSATLLSDHSPGVIATLLRCSPRSRVNILLNPRGFVLTITCCAGATGAIAA